MKRETHETLKVQDGNVVYWLNEEELRTIPTSAYWNDEEMEKEKPFYLVDGNAEKLWRYLRDTTTYYQQYKAVLKLADDLGCKIRGIGVDIAAGVCWTTALISQHDGVEKVYAIEMSKHRLLRLAPVVCAALGAFQSKIIRALGSFYDIRLPDGSVDFCMVAQAFHHADDPRRLLKELYRILKPGAATLIMGEAPIYPMGLLKRRIKNAAKFVLPSPFYTAPPVYKLVPSFDDLFPPDPKSGDHYYRIRDYDEIFDACGFTLHRRRASGDAVFVAVKGK